MNKKEPIINSLLDNDLYKFTMLQAFLHYEKNTLGEYLFTCRTPCVDFTDTIDEINNQIDCLCELSLSSEELDYLHSLQFIKPFFVEFLNGFKLNRSDICASVDFSGALNIRIKAPIVNATLFEVPVLAIVNQVYFEAKIKEGKSINGESVIAYGLKKLDEKLNLIKSVSAGIRFSDFGTRRRFAFYWHKQVLERILDSKYPGFMGTSNVYFAKKLGINPIGTMAHEWIMTHAGITSLKNSTSLALKRWLDFYDGKQCVALTDTYTTDYFLKHFNNELASAYYGVKHYEKLGVDPASKLLVFSDNLDFKKIIEIHREFEGKTKLAFGIGTNLTNDVGFDAIQIVIKMIKSNGKPVIKISDSHDKTISYDKKFEEFALGEIRENS
jgi:nicotinate phosphoribosyltransferase